MFSIRLNIPPDLDAVPQPSVSTGDAQKSDEEPSDLLSILAAICDRLATIGDSHFQIEGFGQVNWPVDVRTDLLTFLEQLPALVRWLNAEVSDAFELDFYEQGVERTLFFDKADVPIRITCNSRTNWQPVPSHELINLIQLRTQLRSFIKTFTSLVKAYCSDYYYCVLLQNWFDELTILIT